MAKIRSDVGSFYNSKLDFLKKKIYIVIIIIIIIIITVLFFFPDFKLLMFHYNIVKQFRNSEQVELENMHQTIYPINFLHILQLFLLWDN